MSILSDLQTILRSDQVTTNETQLLHHSHDESYHTPCLPEVVVFPECREDVIQVLRYAHTNKVPVVPYGAGSSLEGHAIPVRGGISMDIMRMNRILEIRPDDFLVRVQPGVTKMQLNETLKRHGLFFSVDPGADASMGGMAATNASGTTTVRYGTMADQVKALEVVLPDGQVIRTGSLAPKSTSGLHLNGLFVGSEGTLGVFTELWLRVYGIPESILAARATFSSVEQCVKASTCIIAAGIPVARIEVVDQRIMRGVNAWKKTRYPECPTVFLEFHGSAAALYQDANLVKEIVYTEGATSFAFEEDEESRRRLWDARHIAGTAFTAQFPGKRHMATDVCVPLSELTGAVAHAKQVMDREDVMGGIVGHVGDGNFHALLILDPQNQTELEAAWRVNEALVHHALERGGTCTGEHGVGLGKRKFQEQEHGDALGLMKSIKTLIDPHNIMNPGKLVGD